MKGTLEKKSKTEMKSKIKQETFKGRCNYKNQSCRARTEEEVRGTEAPITWTGSEIARAGMWGKSIEVMYVT